MSRWAPGELLSSSAGDWEWFPNITGMIANLPGFANSSSVTSHPQADAHAFARALRRIIPLSCTSIISSPPMNGMRLLFPRLTAAMNYRTFLQIVRITMKLGPHS
jgi:hypothetical protein